MKSFYTILFILSSISLFNSQALVAQDHADIIERTLQVSQTDNPSNKLAIYNIYGNVTVEGYPGSEIQVTARREIEGNAREVEQALQELKFVTEREGNTIYVYIDGPFIHLEKDGDDHFNYNIRDWNRDYDFVHDITVRVPRDVQVLASTINDGNVSVTNITRRIAASNVNGSIHLQDISAATETHTVNGDITVHYTRAPRNDSHYTTVNGTIKVYYPKNLSADIHFKSMNGELYTDFNNIERLNAKVETNREPKHAAVKYKVNRFAPIRIGDGGPTFKFEVLNGNVYIQKIQS